MKWFYALCTVLLIGYLCVPALHGNEDVETFDDTAGPGFIINTVKSRNTRKSHPADLKVTFPEAPGRQEGKNKAIRMLVENLAVFSRLKGLKARYVVVDLALENVLQSERVIASEGPSHPSRWIAGNGEGYEYREQVPPYLIPDMTEHLYLRINNNNQIRIDMISLLLDHPLLSLEDMALEVLPGKTEKGTLAFRIPENEELRELSLHFYDTRYGNIDIPLLGEMAENTSLVSALPKQSRRRMSDNLTIAVTGYKTLKKINGMQAGPGGQFEILEIAIQSKVFARLRFDPFRRFYLMIGGDHMVGLHPVTQALPRGLFGTASLAPGSRNRFLLAFYTPDSLQDKSRSLGMELQGTDILIPVTKGTGRKGQFKNRLAQATADGLAVTINGIYRRGDGIVADMTFTDDGSDNLATRVSNDFVLNKKPELPARGIRQEDVAVMQRSHAGLGGFAVNRAKSDWYHSLACDDTIFGMKEEEVVLNGTSKRVFVRFPDPFENNSERPWYLVSPLFKSLTLKMDKSIPRLPAELNYISTGIYPYRNSQDAVEEKVLAMVEQAREKRGKKTAGRRKNLHRIPTLSLGTKKALLQTIPPLQADDSGQKTLAGMKNVDSLVSELKKLSWVPSAYAPTVAMYSPAAVFTQKWASENDMFLAVYQKLKKENYEIRYGSYSLTIAGRKYLQPLAGTIPVADSMPFIEWQEEGERHTLVFPFLKPVEEVQQFLGGKTYLSRVVHGKAEINMVLVYRPESNGSSSGLIGGLGNALSGGEVSDTTGTVFKQSWNLSEISGAPVDIYFSSDTAYFFDNKGLHTDKTHSWDSKHITPKRLYIDITMPDGQVDSFSYRFREDEKLRDIFFTFALGTPDIPADLLQEMDDRKKSLFKGRKLTEIDPLSRLQWENRAKIYRFVAMQTRYEKQLEKKLHVRAKRNKSPRVIMATIEKEKRKNIRSAIDLRRVYSDVYGDRSAVRSFNLIAGIFSTEAEALAVADGENTFSRWLQQGEVKTAFIPPSLRSRFLKILREQGVSRDILTRLEKSNNCWIFPMNPKGQIAWLEIDPESYRLISVHENGMYSAMTERAAMENMENTLRYALGLLIGTDVSLGTTMAYALTEEDYRVLKQKAHMHAELIACFLKKIESFNFSEAIKEEAQAQKEAILHGEERGEPLEELIKSFDCGKEDAGDGGAGKDVPEEYKDYVNFGQGLDNAISRYFQ